MIKQSSKISCLLIIFLFLHQESYSQCTGTADSVSCNGKSDGKINLAVPSNSYIWSNGKTTKDITGLGPGDYTVTVTYNTTSTCTNQWTIGEPDPLNVSETHTNLTCSGNNTGKIDLTVSGGTTPYTFKWSNAASAQTTQSVTGLPANTYSVTVTDKNGCTEVKNNITLIQPQDIVINPKADSVSCNGLNDGKIITNASGGTPGYTYKWSPNNETSVNLLNKPAGTYSVTVTDSKGCTKASGNIPISQPSTLSVSTQPNLSVCEGSGLSFTATTSGGTTPYKYDWSNGFNTQVVNISNATLIHSGIYSVTVTDKKSCTKSSSVSVTVNPKPLVNAGNDISVCEGNTIFLNADTTNGKGTQPFSFKWSGPSFSSNIQKPTINNANTPRTGDYSVTVTDSKNCTATDKVHVEVNSLPVLNNTIAVNTSPICQGNDISLTASSTFATKFLWKVSPPASGSIPDSSTTGTVSLKLSSAFSGNLTVTVKTKNGCGISKDSTKKNITVIPTPPLPSIVDSVQSSCTGSSGNIFSVEQDPDFNYFWNADEGVTFDNDGKYTSVTFNKPSNINVYVTVTAKQSGCQNVLTFPVQVSSIPISSNQLIKVPNDPDNTLLCLNNKVSCYQWGYDTKNSRKPNILSGEVYQSYSAGDSYDPANKNYWVITCEGQCKTKSYFNPTVSANNLSNKTTSVSILQNPATGSLSYSAKGNFTGIITLNIYSVTGKKVLEQFSFNKTSMELTEQINITGIAPGFYLLETRIDNNIISINKLIVQ